MEMSKRIFNKNVLANIVIKLIFGKNAMEFLAEQKRFTHYANTTNTSQNVDKVIYILIQNFDRIFVLYLFI